MTNRDTVLTQSYDPERVEAEWPARWLRAGAFRSDPHADGEPFCVLLPPPNVTGALHIGHALNSTLQDILVRHARMAGKNVLWQPGLDHAGIATQTVVERKLAAEGKDRRTMGREAFLDEVWAWKENSGGRILQQMERLGASCDWDRLRFTMDAPSSRAVLEAFVQLWDEGLIYRGERLVNWDPATQTALSDLEVDHEQRQGELWQFAYPLADGDGEVVVATTRPETMLGDTAVAVHPDDERYRGLVGKRLRHPIFPERNLFIIADTYVDPEFGSGAVKITPAHDPNDFAIGQRHALPFLNILNPDATINEHGGEFSGMDRFDARRAVQKKLAELGLERGRETIEHAVTVSQRSGAVTEPMISRQYFVQMTGMAQAAKAAVDRGETALIPASWQKTWDHFLDNIQDWCISRQLWWGHRIPIFYDLDALPEAIRADADTRGTRTSLLNRLETDAPLHTLLPQALNELDDAAVRMLSKASTENLAAADPNRWVQEEDVLDTWFSSGLWPFSTLGWPDRTDALNTWYPTATLVTAFDILFFWVARMMMLGLHFMGRPPFDDVVLHALVRDEHGQKMSKTKGNVVDPVAMIETYGADAVRFTLAAMTSLGRDISLSPKRIEGHRHFANKLWNACRFVLRALPEDATPPAAAQAPEHPWNRWLLQTIDATAADMNAAIEAYAFHDFCQLAYQLSWDRFCDWYLEGAKVLLQDAQWAEETRATLLTGFERLLRLLHPVMPFVTEELAAALPWQDDRPLALRSYPRGAQADPKLARDWMLLQEAVTAVRNIRGENGLNPTQPLEVLLEPAAAAQHLLDETWRPLLTSLARISTLTPAHAAQAPEFSATYAGTEIQLWVPLAGLIDVDAEIHRLEKQLDDARKLHTQASRKLDNRNFVDKAPEDVVAKERDKLTEAEAVLTRAGAHLSRLQSLRQAQPPS